MCCDAGLIARLMLTSCRMHRPARHTLLVSCLPGPASYICQPVQVSWSLLEQDHPPPYLSMMVGWATYGSSDMVSEVWCAYCGLVAGSKAGAANEGHLMRKWRKGCPQYLTRYRDDRGKNCSPYFAQFKHMPRYPQIGDYLVNYQCTSIFDSTWQFRISCFRSHARHWEGTYTAWMARSTTTSRYPFRI